MSNPEDSRKLIYKPTFELLSFMGIRSVEELPEYATVNPTITKENEKLTEEHTDDN